MAKVVYRGAAYDTQERRDGNQGKTADSRWFNEIYRGIKHKEPVVVVGN